MNRQAVRSFDFEQMQPVEMYKLIAGSVVPRPIAWVSTVDRAGTQNLAPFSFFNAVCANPPTLLFCPAVREPKDNLLATKDTLENIRATSEFVVNVVTDETAEAMNLTSAQLAPSEDEFLHAGVTPLASETVKPPRVAEAKVQMECRLQQIVEIGTESMSASIVIGRIVRFHIADELLLPRGHVSAEKLQAIGRLAGNDYVRTSERFEMIRPR